MNARVSEKEAIRRMKIREALRVTRVKKRAQAYAKSRDTALEKIQARVQPRARRVDIDAVLVAISGTKTAKRAEKKPALPMMGTARSIHW